MIAIDWGTSSLRAYLLSAGKLCETRTTMQGILQVSGDAFQQVFSEITQGWDGDVYMAGMVGSSKGWLETPYCTAPFPLTDLGKHLVEVSHLAGRRAWIVPGIQQEQPPNVMRGEEVQILGSLQRFESDCIILCGTHSKHVQVEQGVLTRFETFMTGELYALLQKHSILAGTEDWDQDDFIWGLREGVRDARLLQQLFTVRAQTLNQSLRHPRAYLSGLLIGSELGAAGILREASSCIVVGSQRLTQLYQIALETLLPSIQINILSAEEATRNGLQYISESV